MASHFEARDVPPQTRVSLRLTGAANASFATRINRSGGGSETFTEAELRAGSAGVSTHAGTSYWILVLAHWRKAGTGRLVTTFTDAAGQPVKPPVTMALQEPADGKTKCSIVVF